MSWAGKLVCSSSPNSQNQTSYNSAGTALDIDSLWDVMTELHDVRDKWKMIGLGLRLPHSDLEAISGSPQDCLERSMSKWLKRVDPPPTWQAIVAVLRSKVVGEERIAKELEEKFCRDIPSEAPVKGIIIAIIIVAKSTVYCIVILSLYPLQSLKHNLRLVRVQWVLWSLRCHQVSTSPLPIYNIIFN